MRLGYGFPPARRRIHGLPDRQIDPSSLRPTRLDMSLPEMHPLGRMLTAQSVIRTSRRQGDAALELDAWDYFAAAM